MDAKCFENLGIEIFRRSTEFISSPVCWARDLLESFGLGRRSPMFTGGSLGACYQHVRKPVINANNHWTERLLFVASDTACYQLMVTNSRTVKQLC